MTEMLFLVTTCNFDGSYTVLYYSYLKLNKNFLLSNTKIKCFYLELSSLYLGLYQQTDGIKEINPC